MPEDITNPGSQSPLGRNVDTTTITINPRTLGLAALLFLGGFGGGGVGSNLIGDDVKDEVGQLQKEVQDLKHSVETVAVSVVEIKADIKSQRRHEESVSKRLEDHEERLRILETRRGR